MKTKLLLTLTLSLLLCSCAATAVRTSTLSQKPPAVFVSQREFDFRAGAADMCVLLPKTDTDSAPTYTRDQCIDVVKNMIAAGYYSAYLKSAGNQARGLAFYSGALNLCMYVGRTRETCDSFVEGLQSMDRFENYLKELNKVSSTPTPTGPQG